MMATFENWMSRRKGKQSGDVFKLDIKNKTPEENIIEIIQGLYLKKPVLNDTSPTNKNATKELRSSLGIRSMQRSGSDTYRLSYLNALVTLLCKEDRSDIGFTNDELMACMRASLVDESMVIRAAALRVLRYLIKTEHDVATFNNLKLPYLIVRSIDLILRNEEERAQALRVVRRIVAIVGTVSEEERRYRSALVDPGLLRCLVAVARANTTGDGTVDRLARPAIATLAEISILNPDMFITCGGVSAVTRQLLECATPRMAEALCGVLLHTLNDPVSRRLARVDLTCLSSPYCDFHVRGTNNSRDEREMRFTCSRLALVCVLRSWPGLLHFCHPQAPTGLKALVAALHLPRLEVRKAILDLLYELVGLPLPEWTDEISVALGAVDPSDFQDSWRLNEEFVAAEGTSVLPHLSATGPDITEIHLALLLHCFLEAGLLDGLAEVIVTSDTFISVRATVLLGQLLHLIHLLLPPQICNFTPALPALMSQASTGKPQALAAVAALQRLHTILEARPASCSLFLDHIIQYCSGAFKEKPEDSTKSRKEQDNANMAKDNLYKDNSIEFLNDSDGEEPKQRHSIGSKADIQSRNVSALVKSKSVSSRTSVAVSKVTKSAKFFNLFERDSDSLIRATSVMQNKDGNTWDWDIIRTILKENDSSPFLNLNDSGHRAWVSRLIGYLRPSANKYSHTDLSATCLSATRAGCQLIRHLLRHNDAESQRLLEEFFSDVCRQIVAIETGKRAHECLFSPQHMCNTMCQMYFLFVGQLCHSQTGLKLFKQSKLYDNLVELSTKTHHSCYVKLVISSLDYTLDSYPREILAKTLTCHIQASRLYATQFLNVLLRASQKSREMVRRKSKLKKNLAQEVKSKSTSDGIGVDMDTWILQMLVGQIRDESKAVVKCALGILEEAYSVPSYVEKLITLKDTLAINCRLDKHADPALLDFSVGGDRGYILWLSLEVAAANSEQKSVNFISRHLDYWTRSYNYRYVRLVESVIQEALGRCESETIRARGRRAARPHTHIHAALARTEALHAHLLTPLQYHYTMLQRKSCSSEQEIMDLKASLWAVGHTAVTSNGLQLVMGLSGGFLEHSVPVLIIRLAKYCPVYAVRATALYVLGLIGSTYDGANLLSDLGWLCVRHTRHDQFPIIKEELYSYDPAYSCHVTTPTRCRYENDTSEMSDHSTAESLHSDHTKISTKATIETQDIDVVDHKLNFPEKAPDKRKSNTLPSQGCSSTHDRSTISESRTVDILKDYSFERPRERPILGRIASDHSHEGRVRNTSESSTSGVSSCDSFLGKYAMPDRVVTLSPIPSSSSLYGMKTSSSGSQRPRLAELHRRTSTCSFSHDVSSSPTNLDMSGYATLRSLNTHRRPHLSESAASSELEDLSWLLSDTSRRPRAFSSLRDRAKSTRDRMAKLSLLDYDWKPLPVAECGAMTSSVITSAPARRAQRRMPAPLSPTASYMGICLPRDIRDLFPGDIENKVSEEEIVNKSEHTRACRIPSLLGDSSIASNENKSRATPDAKHAAKGGEVSGSGTSSGVDVRNVASPKTLGEHPHHENKKTSIAGSTSAVAAATSITSGGSHRKPAPLTKWRHSAADCLACVRVRPPSAHELREAFFAAESPVGGDSVCESGAETPEPATPQAEVLRHAHYMSNPIHLRQTRTALLSLKQRHPDIFRSACVYSDICALLARDTYLLCARRFLQELFLDANFEAFLSEPVNILSRHVPMLSPITPTPDTAK